MNPKTVAKTELEDYSLLRFFHRTNRRATIYYCYDDSLSDHKKRKWASTEKRHLAYKFSKRDDARRAANGACWKTIVEDSYYWEIIEVREIRVTVQTFIEQTVATNASPLIALAKMA